MKYAIIIWDFFKTNFKYIVLFILGMVLMSLFKCEGEKPIQADPLKTKIQADLKKDGVLKAVEKKSDSVRTVTIIKWKQAKETIKYLPCDSAIKIIVLTCDTVIKADSTEIFNLKAIIANKDTTIKDLFTLHQSDSTTIHGLQKAVRRQKLKTKLVIAGWILREGARAVSDLKP